MSGYTPGRNLVLKGGTAKTSPASASNSAYTGYWYFAPGTDGLLAEGTVVTISFDWSVSGASKAGSNPVQFYPQLNNAIGNTVTYKPSVASCSGRYVLTFAIVAAQANAENYRIRVMLQNAADGATITASNLKLELGSNASPVFTPAPEDLDPNYTYAVLCSDSLTLTHVVDIKAYYRFYRIQLSTSAPPAKPSGIASLPPSGWEDSEPAWQTNGTYSMYTVDLTVFSDDTYRYGSVNLSSDYEAAKAAWNKAVAAQSQAYRAGIANDLIVGTQTTTTAAWTGSAGMIDALEDGMAILYWLPQTSASNATLNLTLSDGTATGALPVFYSGTTRVGTHYAAGSVIRLVYRYQTTIGTGTAKYTGWWCDANYDSNNYDRIRLNNSIKASAACTAGRLIVHKDGGYRNIANGLAIDLDSPILYCGSTLAADGTGTNNYISYPSVNATTSISGTALTANESVYLKGVASGAAFTLDSTAPITTEVPASEDGKDYILLGYAYSATSLYLYPEHPMYRFDGDAFKSVGQIAHEAYASATETAQTVESHTTRLDQHDTEIAAKAESTYISQILDGTPGFMEEFDVTPLPKFRLSYDYECDSNLAKASEATANPDVYFQMGTSIINGSNRTVSAGASGHVTVAFTATESQLNWCRTNHPRIRARLRNAADSTKCTVSNVILTAGEEEYPYSPAPEDVGHYGGGLYPGRNLALGTLEPRRTGQANADYTRDYLLIGGHAGLQHSLTSLEQQTADLRISSDGIMASVTNLQAEAHDLGQDIDAVRGDLNGFITQAGETYATKTEIQQSSSSILARVQSTEGNLASFQTATEAMLDAEGLHISTANSPTTSRIDGDGMEITDNNGKVLAKFTTGKSEIDSVRMVGTLEFGAHQIETTEKTEWDGTSTAGTAFLWIGPVEA